MLGLIIIIIFVIIFKATLIRCCNCFCKMMCKKQVIIDKDLDYFGTYSS